MKLHSWGRELDPRKLAAEQRRRRLMIYSAVYGSSAAAFMVTITAIVTRH